MKRLFIIPVLPFFALSSVFAVDVTVYNNNLGLVTENRTFHLKHGVNELQITDVASQIDATSVHFKSLTDPEGTSVLEQNFQYDLLNQDKLLDKYVGKEISLETMDGKNGDKPTIMKGILLSNSGGRILKVGSQIYVNPPGNPVLPELPEGLLTKPTLLWHIKADKSADHNCEVTYMTGGMSWKADYVVVTSAKDDKMDLNAWVTLDNTSGAVYKDAKLKLVAGDVNRVDNSRPEGRVYKAMAMASGMAEDKAFEEKSFFEYHLYTLQRPTTLMNNETKQIEMAKAADIPLKKKYIYDGAQNVYLYNSDYANVDPGFGTQSDKKVWVILEFKNSKDNNLGIPLPQGRIRVYKKDTDDSLQFIGEDSIDHTPKDETVRVKMGKAFDVVGERKHKDYVADKRSFQETFEIKLRNHKEEPITVNVVEHMYRGNNWKMIDKSADYKKKDANTIEFEVPVPKDGEATVTYTVKYWW